MSEHEHVWQTFVNAVGDRESTTCKICGVERYGHIVDADELDDQVKKQAAGIMAIARQYANQQTRELEQQLAEARAQAEHFAELGQESDMQAAAVLQELAEARALLERVASFDSYDDYSIVPLQHEIEVFLHKESG